jgi:hypothetical protein
VKGAIIMAMAPNKEGSMELHHAPSPGRRGRTSVVRRIRWTVGLAACGALATAGIALASASTGSYSGTTSENTAVTLKIVNHGKTISGFKTLLGYNGKCGQGGGPGLTASIGTIPIGHNGKFSKKTTLFLNAKVKVRDPGQVSGTASGATVKGTVVQVLKGKPNQCYTETFTAHRTAVVRG